MSSLSADDVFRPTPQDSYLPTVNEQLYHLNDEELRFFKATTGIPVEEELRTHIIAVQREAYQVRRYPCITNFSFTNLRLARLPGYEKLLELGRKRKDPILVDIGCCFGNDVRKAIADGYPQENVIATDIVSEFWQLGHRLFNTTPETFPVPFIQGDIFDPTFLDSVPPFYVAPPDAARQLQEVSTLNELHGRVSAISICAVFHLFNTEEAHARLARALAGLLSPEPGSMIIGVDRGSRKKEHTGATFAGKEYAAFYHSPESWAELWDGGIFKKDTVKVDARLVEQSRWAIRDGKPEEGRYLFMEWSVTRL